MEKAFYPNNLDKSQKRKKLIKLLALLIGFNVVIFGAFYFSVKENSFNTNERIAKASPSSSPIPFQEMTIPYLKNRDYSSSLSALNQTAESSAYTGYLTSYDSEGYRVNGYLTIPKGERPANGFPAIIFVHGYIPPTNYRTLENYSSHVDYLAKNGFVVFKIDLRGHGQSEGEPGGGYFSGDYVIDVLNAKAALEGSQVVNPEKIGLWGHSMAGNVVSRALAAKPTEIKAVAIWAGAVYTYLDMQELGIDDNSYQPPASDSPSRQRRNKLFETYGQFDPNSSFWKQVPMTNYLSDIEGAISLNHARDDSVVTIEYSRNLAKILEENSIEYELNEYAGGGHNISGPYFNQAMQKTADFFKSEL